MLYVEQNGTIRLTRGDTARFSVQISNDLSEEGYTISSEDKLTLTVKKRVKDETPLLQKTAIGTTLFHIKPSDISGMEFRKYVYDVQLTTSGGDVYTIVEPSTFEILSELTY